MKQERKEQRKEFYEKNKERLIKYQKNRYKTLLDVFQEWKTTLKCSKCGEADFSCLDFHHSDPSRKDDGVVRQITKSLSSVLKELRKCVVVCANCHRKIHVYNIPTDPTIDDLATKFEKFVNQKEQYINQVRRETISVVVDRKV